MKSNRESTNSFPVSTEFAVNINGNLSLPQEVNVHPDVFVTLENEV